MRRTDEYYEYDASELEVAKIVDGDTIDVRITITDDIGFGTTSTATTHVRLRLARINTPELNRRAQRPAGLAAKTALEQLLEPGLAMIRTYKTDAFHRYIADLWTDQAATSLSDQLVTTGHAEYKNY